MSADSKNSLTHILQALDRQDSGAQDRLYNLVYGELRALARGPMRQRGPDESMQLSSMVQEAYLRLASGQPVKWENRRHFFGAALRAMRQILIERARRRRTARHGGGYARVELIDNLSTGDLPRVDFIDLDAALVRLASRDSRKAQVVQYRFLLGMSVPEVAKVLDVSPRTVDKDWSFAKAWLRRELSGKPPQQE